MITQTRMLLLKKLYPEAVFVSTIDEKHKKYENTTDFIDKIRKEIKIPIQYQSVNLGK